MTKYAVYLDLYHREYKILYLESRRRGRRERPSERAYEIGRDVPLELPRGDERDNYDAVSRER